MISRRNHRLTAILAWASAFVPGMIGLGNTLLPDFISIHCNLSVDERTHEGENCLSSLLDVSIE
jgi:hypothetical protein